MASDRPHGAPPPVVILEDDVDTLELYSMSLRVAGYDTHSARTARDALQLVRAIRPRVVVTDLTLPDLSGVTLCRALAEAGGRELRALIVVSGSADEKVLAGVQAAGARVILPKPCLPMDLEAAIRHAIG